MSIYPWHRERLSVWGPRWGSEVLVRLIVEEHWARTRPTWSGSGTRNRCLRPQVPAGLGPARQAAGRPSQTLLGGKMQERLPVYATGNEVAWYQEIGSSLFKLAMPHAPANGPAGMALRGRQGVWVSELGHQSRAADISY